MFGDHILGFGSLVGMSYKTMTSELDMVVEDVASWVPGLKELQALAIYSYNHPGVLAIRIIPAEWIHHDLRQ